MRGHSSRYNRRMFGQSRIFTFIEEMYRWADNEPLKFVVVWACIAVATSLVALPRKTAHSPVKLASAGAGAVTIVFALIQLIDFGCTESSWFSANEWATPLKIAFVTLLIGWFLSFALAWLLRLAPVTVQTIAWWLAIGVLALVLAWLTAVWMNVGLFYCSKYDVPWINNSLNFVFDYWFTPEPSYDCPTC